MSAISWRVFSSDTVFPKYNSCKCECHNVSFARVIRTRTDSLWVLANSITHRAKYSNSTLYIRARFCFIVTRFSYGSRFIINFAELLLEQKRTKRSNKNIPSHFMLEQCTKSNPSVHTLRRINYEKCSNNVNIQCCTYNADDILTTKVTIQFMTIYNAYNFCRWFQ